MSIELPEEIQSAVDQLGPQATPQPVVAAPQVPPTVAGNPTAVPQSDVAAPSAPQPGSLADKISKAFLEHLAKNQPQPVAQHSTLGNVAAGAEGVMTALGDAAHASDRPGGWLSGVTNVLSARNQRLSAEQQQAFQQQEQKRKDDALIAMNQAQTVATQRNIYRQDAELRDKSYQHGVDYVKALSANHDVQENISQDELSNLIQKDPKYLQTHYARAISETPVLDGDGKPQTDSNGNPVMSPIYTLVSRATKNGEPDVVEVSPGMSADLKKYLGQDVPEGTKLNTDQFTAWAGKIQGIENAVNALNKSRSEAINDDVLRQRAVDLQNESVQHAIASVPNKPLLGLYNASQIADQHIVVGQAALQGHSRKVTSKELLRHSKQSTQRPRKRARLPALLLVLSPPRTSASLQKTKRRNAITKQMN